MCDSVGNCGTDFQLVCFEQTLTVTILENMVELHYPTHFQLLLLPTQGHYSCDMELTLILTLAEKLRSIEPNYLIITLSVFCV